MKYLSKTLLAAACFAGLSFTASAAPLFQVITADITTSTTWTPDTVYILGKIVFVKDGATLTIEPGVIVRGITEQVSGFNNQPGALVATRTGLIVANGTADNPIIITSIDDPYVPGGGATIPASFVNGQGVTQTRGVEYGTIEYDVETSQGAAPASNGFAQNSQWGGLIILGNAYVAQGTQGRPDANGDGFPEGPIVDATTTNDPNARGTDIIEGLDPVQIPGLTVTGVYGGTDTLDNAGVYRFVSVRYGGFQIGTANEINSVTMGGIGRETVLEFVEATFNVDDGFEFFGGQCDTRHLYALYNLDDSFDGDEGYQGINQFWFVMQGLKTGTASGYGADYVVNVNDVFGTGNAFDRLTEFDGPEPFVNPRTVTPQLPETVMDVYNFTMLSRTNGLRAREFAFVDFLNGLVEDAATVSNNSAPFTSEAPNVRFVNGAAGSWTANPPTPIAGTQVNGKGKYTKNGLDPRLNATGKSGAGVLSSTGSLPPSGFVQVNQASYMIDNTFLGGWSHLAYLQLLPLDNIARPTISVTRNGANQEIAFASTVAGARYVVERSSDERRWTPVNDVVDGDGADADGTGGAIRVVDNQPFTVDTPIYYRAYAL